MNKIKATEIYTELKSMCPGLMLTGSTLRGKKENIQEIHLIWLGRIFPIHSLPVGQMEKTFTHVHNDVLEFIYKGEQFYIHRATSENVGALMLGLTGPKEFISSLNARATNMVLRLDNTGLYKGKKLIASKTEYDIFDALQLKWIAPEDRDKN
jgi:DNA polymerase/3'-5' exonuclease PolX